MNKGLKIRMQMTLDLIKKYTAPNSKIYDFGHKSIMSEWMEKEGYTVVNNSTEVDLDFNQDEITKLSSEADLTTSFEVFEHLTNLFAVLMAIKSKKMLITVPAKVWFKSAYWGPNDFDHHYHEFEYKQIEKILNKTGWQVKEHGFWKVSFGWGLYSLLRKIWPSYIWIYVEKK